jgi:tetratricopeptide (TPR) repeat protein
VTALSILAFRFISPVINAQSPNPDSDIRQADELASRALAADPGSYMAHLAKAYVLMSQNRHEEAIVEAEHSLTLNPSFISAYFALASANNFLGRPDQALFFSDKAIRLSPRDPVLWVFYHEKGWSYFMKGQYDRAVDSLRQAVAIVSSRSSLASAKFSLLLLASSLALTGHQEQAHAALWRYLSLGGVSTTSTTQLRTQQLALANNPVWVEYNERLFSGLREAGMAEQ